MVQYLIWEFATCKGAPFADLDGTNSARDNQYMPFPERDWKHLRALHTVALARYCDRILAEASAIVADDAVSAHQRYLDLAHAIAHHNRQVADAFDDMRRSRAIQRLSAMISLRLLTPEELLQFSSETRSAVLPLRGVASESPEDLAR